MKNRIIVLGILLILVCLMVMLLPKTAPNDHGIVSDEVEFSEPAAPSQDPLVDEETALKMVLQKVSGAKTVDIESFSQEYKNGIWIYDGSVKVPKKKIVYDFQIDADQGEFLMWEARNEDQRKK